VSGAVFLDENMETFADGILVGTHRQIHTMVQVDSDEPSLSATVAFGAGATTTSSVEITLARVGSYGPEMSTYLGTFGLQTPQQVAKDGEPSVVVTGTGTLSTLIDAEPHAEALASEVWVEVEQILDQDGNEVTGQVIDVKQMAPLGIRYRVKGTEQHVQHLVSVIVAQTDPANQVHEDFYGSPGPATVSEVVELHPETIINGFYESEWAGRDNTGDDRILLQGSYTLLADVTLQQNGNDVVASTRDDSWAFIEVGKPHASNYGPFYPPPLNPRDYSQEVILAATLQTGLTDGTAFETLDIVASTHPHVSEVLDRLVNDDALMFFVGHSDGRGTARNGYGSGQVGFWNGGSTSGTCANASQLAATRSALQAPPFVDTSYIEDLPDNALRDLHLVVFAGCWTDSPTRPTPDNLPISLLGKGADIALGFRNSEGGSTKWLLLQSWINTFWPYATGVEDVAGERLNLFESVEVARAHALADDQELWTAEDLEVFQRMQLLHAQGVSPYDNLWPARHGRSSN